MYRFNYDWFSARVPFWEETLKKTNKRHGKLEILEIGSFEGRSATWISDNLLDHDESFLTCIDTFEGSNEHLNKKITSSLYETFKYNITQSKNSKKIKTIVGDSHAALPKLIELNQKYDIIYVDGGHSFEDVIQDGRDAYKLIKDDGVIIFDDYKWFTTKKSGIIRTVKYAVDVLESELQLKLIASDWQRAYTK